MSYFEKIKTSAKTDVHKLVSHGAVQLFISMVLVKILGFPVQIFLARFLGPAAMGHIAVINAVINFAGIVSLMGISASVLKFISEPVPDEEKRSLLFHGLVIVMATSLLTMTATFLAASLELVKDSTANYYLRFLAFTIPFTALSGIMVLNFHARKEIVKKARIDLRIKIFSVIFFIGGAWFFGLKGYIAARIGIAILTAGAVFAAGKKYISFQKINPAIIKRMVKFGLWGIFAEMTLLVVSTADIICLTEILGSANIVGHYSIAVLLMQFVRLLPLAIMDASFPYLSEIGRDRKALAASYSRMFKRMIIMMIVVCAGAFLLGGFGIELLFGTKYLDSIQPFLILLMALFFFSIGAPAGRIILAMGKIHVNFFISLIAGAINIPLNILLIQQYGMIGAAWATAVTYGVWFVCTQGAYFMLARN
ncbi:MAG: flippase [bacterium]|nr:flippase [bacterium]